MHRLFHPGLLLLALWAGALLLPTQGISQYEGTIEMRVSMTEGDSLRSSTYRMHVQRDKLAATIDGASSGGMQGGAFIFRGDRKLLWIVNDDQKTFLELSLKNVDTAGAKNQPSDNAKLERTGNKKLILGYACDEFVVRGESEQIQIWATTKLGNVYEGLLKSFGELGSAQMRDQSGWEAQLSAMKLFPLLFVTKRNGALFETQEVTKIEARKLPASLFEPPRGYKKESMEFDMEKFMRQMQENEEAPDTSDD